MSAIITLSAGNALPAYLKTRDTSVPSINADIVGFGSSYFNLSIKGKVFTLVKGDERKVLMRADDPDETLQSLTLNVVRANAKSRVFYAKSYVEGAEGEAARPDCQSSDGVSPAADSRSPQSKSCQACPHAVWGSKQGKPGDTGEAKGTACTVNTRLAVIDPEQLATTGEADPYLLRVPAASRKNFAEVVKTAQARGIDYNMLAVKIAFDKEAPSPKLTFKIAGLVSDDVYAKVQALFNDDTIKDIVGLGPVHAAPAQLAAPTVTEEDLDAALAAKAAVQKAAAKPVPAPAPKPVAASEDDLDALMGMTAAAAPAPAPKPVAVKPKPAAKPTPAPVAAPAGDEDLNSLLGGLDALLGGTDD